VTCTDEVTTLNTYTKHSKRINSALLINTNLQIPNQWCSEKLVTGACCGVEGRRGHAGVNK